MKIFLIISIFWLCSCGSSIANYTSWFSSYGGDSPQESSEEDNSEVKEPYILLQSSNKKVNLSKFNRSKSTLTLSDQIFFPSISEGVEDSEFHAFDKIKEGELFKLKISSLCTSIVSDDKVVKEFFSFKYKSNFTFLHIIPEEVLVNLEEKSFTCSFIFSFRGDDQDVSHYLVTQQSIISSHQEKGLLLGNTTNGKLNIYSPLDIGDTKSISLIRQDSKLSDRYRFICNGFTKGISFKLKNLKDSFLFYITSQKNLPEGIRACRIISEKLGFIYGMTQLFQVNFDQLNLEEKTLDINKIKYKLIKEGNPSLTLLEGGFGLSHKIGKYETAYPFSVIRFTGLPEDFSSGKYKDVQVKVESSCSMDLILRKTTRTNYQFLLSEEVSLMSVTPDWFFQLNYSREFLKRNRQLLSHNLEHGLIIKIFYDRINLKEDMECVYEISLEGYGLDGRKTVVTLPKTHYVLKWSPGSYGVNFSSHVGQKSPLVRRTSRNEERITNANSHLSLSRIREEQAGYFNLVFLNQLANKKSWNSYPDKMTLRCGGVDDLFLKVFNLDFFSLDRLGSSIPISLVFSHSSILNYLYENKILKCRLLFYTGDTLRYFSSELRIFK